jgi:hypothetical protein
VRWITARAALLGQGEDVPGITGRVILSHTDPMASLLRGISAVLKQVVVVGHLVETLHDIGVSRTCMPRGGGCLGFGGKLVCVPSVSRNTFIMGLCEWTCQCRAGSVIVLVYCFCYTKKSAIEFASILFQQ